MRTEPIRVAAGRGKAVLLTTDAIVKSDEPRIRFSRDAIFTALRAYHGNGVGVHSAVRNHRNGVGYGLEYDGTYLSIGCYRFGKQATQVIRRWAGVNSR